MIVIDASVAAKWVLLGEEDQQKAFLLLERHENKIDEIIIPDLFLYEIANTLSTKVNIPLTVALRSTKKIIRANLHIYHPIPDEIIETVKLSKKYKTTVYDMLYAVVAKRHKINLITADENFIKKTKFKFVKLVKDI